MKTTAAAKRRAPARSRTRAAEPMALKTTSPTAAPARPRAGKTTKKSPVATARPAAPRATASGSSLAEAARLASARPPGPAGAETLVVTDARALTRSEDAYRRIKAAIFDFVLLPGDGFTESQLAARLGMSRTPVREALFRLEREGYVQVAFRSGWNVAPFDFRRLEELYDLRIVLECAAIDRLCAAESLEPLAALKAAWLVPEKERLRDTAQVAVLDEQFHAALVAATGNAQMSRVHADVTDGIRIVRRLDFTQAQRVAATYEEHAKILRAVLGRRADSAKLLLRTHIEASKAEVRKITLHKLHSARSDRGGL